LISCKNKSSFKYGYIGATPTGEGINMGLRHPSPFLKKISDARKIKYGWIEDNESTYGYYIKTSKIILSMNSRFKNEFDDYIEFHKDNKPTNSLTQIIVELQTIDFDKEFKIIQANEVSVAEIKKIDNGIQVNERKIVDLQTKIENEESNLKHLKDSKCPYCTQHYENQDKIIEIEKRMERLTKDVYDLTINIQDLKKQKSELLVIDTDYTAEILTKLKSKLDSSNTELNYIKEYKSIEIDINPLEEKITRLKELQKQTQDTFNNLPKSMFVSQIALMSNKNEFNKLQEKLKELKESENPHNKTLDNLQQNKPKESSLIGKEMEELDDDIRHYDFIYKLLTKKDSFLRKKLLDKNLPLLNNRLQYYLNELGLQHRVVFNNDLTATISQFNTEINYSLLSTGQKARVNLGVMLAFRDIRQIRHGKVNICMLDECLDLGLSEVGVRMATRLLRNICREQKLNMFIISHRSEIQSQFDKQIKIVLKNGMSEIV
jgi:DNA repair exonuclease SbcCD ATPase subunit